MEKDKKLKPAKLENVQVKQEIEQEEMFLIVSKEGEYFIALGNQIISKERFKTVEEAKNYIQAKPWELIMNVAGVIASFEVHPEKLENNQNTRA